MGTDSKFTQILERLLTQKRRPTLATHINMLGPAEWSLKGTVSPDYKCLEVISIKSPLLGNVTPDI
jgi:hypothetical protein